jgi:hypothetical protein
VKTDVFEEHLTFNSEEKARIERSTLNRKPGSANNKNDEEVTACLNCNVQVD